MPYKGMLAMDEYGTRRVKYWLKHCIEPALKQIGEICKEYNAIFHSDTVQTMGHYLFNMQEINVDFMAASAHKFHGPKGIGFIYINGDHSIKPFIDGGAQERNMRGGTENIYGILGMAKALNLACAKMEEHQAVISEVRNYMKQELEANFRDIEFNGDLDNGHYKLLSVSFPPSSKTDLLLVSLDILGISVSGGSACSSGADAGSHVISALHGDS